MLKKRPDFRYEPVLEQQVAPDELRRLQNMKMEPLPPLEHPHQLLHGEQRSDEWFEKRREFVTASEMDRLLMDDTCVGKAQLLHEKSLPWLRHNTYVNTNMQFGIDNERVALELFASLTNAGGRLRSCCFCTNPRFADIGGSPDAVLVYPQDPARVKAIVEVKCPARLYDTVPRRYALQMSVYMGVMEVTRCYLVQLSQQRQFSVMLFRLDADLFADMALNSALFMQRVRARRNKFENARFVLQRWYTQRMTHGKTTTADKLLALWLPLPQREPLPRRTTGRNVRKRMELDEEPPQELLQSANKR